MKILIITLYYFPLNSISSSRVKGFVDYLQNHNIDVDVITRYYDERQCDGASMLVGKEKAKGFEDDYIKVDNVIYTNFDQDCKEFRTFNALPPFIRGLFAYYKADIYHYGWLKYIEKAYLNECVGKDYDFILASYGPPISMVAASKISRRYGIPSIIDFRDIYIDERDRNLRLVIKRVTQKNLLRRAKGLIFATSGMKEYFNLHADKASRAKPSLVVYSGVDNKHDLISYSEGDKNTVAEFDQIKSSYHYVLLHTGTIYLGQNIHFYISLVEQFNRSSSMKAALVFVGLTENEHVVLDKSADNFYLPRVTQNTAIYLQTKADALILPVWKGRYTGFSGKVFEYLNSGTPVLCGPHPQEDLSIFLKSCGNSFILDNYQDFETALSASKNIKLLGKVQRPDILSRAYWLKQVPRFLESLKIKDTNTADELCEVKS